MLRKVSHNLSLVKTANILCSELVVYACSAMSYNSAIVTDDIVLLLQYDKLQSSMEKTYSTARICNQNGTNCDLSLEPCKKSSGLSVITDKFFFEGQADPDIYT